MGLVYDETERGGRPSATPISEMDATRLWLTHMGNRFYLEFVAERGTFREKAQAGRELLICERKLAFWKRHPRWEQRGAERGLAQLKKDWKR